MKPIKKVIIKDEKYEDGYSELLAKISEKGDLVIDGCDAEELAELLAVKRGQKKRSSPFLTYLTSNDKQSNYGTTI